MQEIEGQLDGAGLKIAIVASRFSKFNAEIVNQLIAGAMEALSRTGVKPDDIAMVRVPGAFEIPLAAQKAAASRKFDGIVALGCVIRGETAHFDYVCRHATDGIGRVMLDYNIPVGFGILTVNTEEQATARAGRGESNAGFGAATAVVEMVNVLRKLSS